MTINDSLDKYPVSPHPGIILKGELEEHGLSQRELASAIGKSAPMVNGILNGSKDITVEIAILLEAALPGSMKASDWLELQNKHDIDVKRGEQGVVARTAAIEIWSCLREHTNLNAIRRRLSLGNDFENNIALIMGTLGISTKSELEDKLLTSNNCFKKSEKVQTDTANLFAWTVIVKHASHKQHINAKFEAERLPNLVKALNAVFYANSSVVENTHKLLNNYGIKFISDEKRLDKVPVDGYSFWIGDNPTIVATQRMNRIDNFAFTIMHELGHIALHLKSNEDKEFLDVDHAIMHMNDHEREANSYAEKALWGEEPLKNAFSEIANPYASAKILEAISRQRRINIGIVVGQYQYYCNKMGLVKNSYAICRDLISKIG